MNKDRAKAFDQPEHKDLVRRTAIADVLKASAFFVVSIETDGTVRYCTLVDGSEKADALMLRIYEQIKNELPDG